MPPPDDGNGTWQRLAQATVIYIPPMSSPIRNTAFARHLAYCFFCTFDRNIIDQAIVFPIESELTCQI
ncbi:hypothetical protein SAMN05660652_03830 [Propionivibrio dicarboxylicus]|uniref:Uncharacterized protein n=1 Tax=Propionivibrio dicarboxylicus TaxID=83767 RepID=A0A1G8MFJ7_9RHOO|nr:hypothetical protein SAMN05660652_03830 [Propionivibrio dicarboxylicus]